MERPRTYPAASGILPALIGVFLIFGLSPASGAVIHVDDDAPGDPGPGDPTVSDPEENGSPEHPFDAIQEGIDAAEDGDEVLVADGTYTGEGNKDLDFAGKAITLRSDNGPETCIIDCEGSPQDQHRGFCFHSGETEASVVDGITICNGCVTDSVSGCWYGGAVCCDQSSPTITNCRITANTASYGGGLGCRDGNPTITNCTVAYNTANQLGGGVWCYESRPSIARCSITENVATDGDGGGIYSSSDDPMITDCTIAGNQAQEGGGVYAIYYGGTISDCNIVGNRAFNEGGGVYCSRRYLSAPTIANCMIADNEAGWAYTFGGGGGVSSRGVTITNCVVTGNRVLRSASIYDTGGGGVYDRGGAIAHCTITGNAAAHGGGVYCGGSGPTQATTISHCTIARNTAVGNDDVCLRAHGGGVFCGQLSWAAITRCTIVDNVAKTPIDVGAGGGGVYCFRYSFPSITFCTIARNTSSDRGGGFGSVRSSATIRNCAIVGNTAFEDGGGVRFRDSYAETVTNCTIAENTAGRRGGGFSCRDVLETGAPRIANCVIMDNTAVAEGGAFHSHDYRAAVSNCTIVGNSATFGRALACDSENQQHPSELALANCILWNGGDEVWNNDDSTIRIAYSDIHGGWPGEGNIEADPLFAEPENGDLHLSVGSPCIDTGDPNFVPEPGETDIDGETRVWDGHGTGEAIVDMGADEFGSFVFGDLNCDGVLNAFDIDPFALALTDPPGYAVAFPDCDAALVDVNGDGEVNGVDVDAFVELLTGG